MSIAKDVKKMTQLAKSNGRNYPEMFWEFYREWVNSRDEYERMNIIDKYGFRIGAYNKWLTELREMIKKHIGQEKKRL
jgi:hypothetical protein